MNWKAMNTHGRNGNGNGNGNGRNSIVAAATMLLVFIFGIGGGAWTVLSTQVAGVQKQIDESRALTDREATRIAAEVNRREAEIKSAIRTIQDELDRRRSEWTNEKEYRTFVGRTEDTITVLRAQLTVLEQTRPTTGVLEAVSKGLEERIRALEAKTAKQPQ